MSRRKIRVRTVLVGLRVFWIIFAVLGAYVLFLIFHTTPAYTHVDGSAAGMHVQLRSLKEGEGKGFERLLGSHLSVFGVKKLQVPNADVTVFGVSEWATLEQNGVQSNSEDTVGTQRISVKAADPDESAIRLLACDGEPHMWLVFSPPCEIRIRAYSGYLGEMPLTAEDFRSSEALSGAPALPKNGEERPNIVLIRTRGHASTVRAYLITIAFTSLDIATEECHVTVDSKVLAKDSRLRAEVHNLTEVTGPSKEADETYVATEIAPAGYPWGMYHFSIFASRVEAFMTDAAGALGDEPIGVKIGSFDIAGQLIVSFSGGPSDAKTEPELSVEGTATYFKINGQEQIQSDWDNLPPGRRDLFKGLLAPNGILAGVLSVLYRRHRGSQS